MRVNRPIMQDVIGRRPQMCAGSKCHTFETSSVWTTQPCLFWNKVTAASNSGESQLSRLAERTNGLWGPAGAGMSTDRQPSAAPPVAASDALPPLGKRQIDRIDQPARPLGTKRAALLLRRRQSAAASSSPHGGASGAHADGPTVKSCDASVELTLRMTIVGLLVERTQRQAMGTSLTQTMVFADQASFDRWCEREPLRFEEPLLYDRLRRQAHESFRGKR